MKIDNTLREGAIKPKEGVELQNFYEGVLNGYTYVDYERQARHLQAALDSVSNGSGNSLKPAEQNSIGQTLN